MAKFTRSYRQDVWANIWNAVLAVGRPSHGGRCAVAVAGSGGAAVALAWKSGLYRNRVQKQLILSVHEGSTPLMDFSPLLKSLWALQTFSILQGDSFQLFELVNEHQVKK